MGRGTPAVLSAMGVTVRTASEAREIGPLLSAAAEDCFGNNKSVAVLINQEYPEANILNITTNSGLIVMCYECYARAAPSGVFSGK